MNSNNLNNNHHGNNRNSSTSTIPNEDHPINLVGIWDGGRHFYAERGVWLTAPQFIARFGMSPREKLMEEMVNYGMDVFQLRYFMDDEQRITQR